MRRTKGLAIAAVIGALIGGAALFRLAAPDNYGLPPFEVREPGATGVRIDEAGLFGNYFPAAGQGPHPGVLLVGGSEGGLGAASLHTALALQQEGFSVFHLAYFGAPGTPEALERIPLEHFDRGLDWLALQTGVDRTRLALVGASKGAEAVLLVAARRSDVRAVVAGMPSSVVWNGVNWSQGGRSTASSWTAAGQDLPTMPFSPWNPAEGVISVYRSIEDPAFAADAERAAIPIERSRAAALLVCGQAETLWPACPMARSIEARARQRGGPEVTVLAYADAGHAVFGPPISAQSPSYERLATYGGTLEGNAAARADSWPRIIAFLRDATTAPRD